MRNVLVFGLNGEKKYELTLPEIFSTNYSPDLIKRAVLSIQSAKKQPQGVKPRAGRFVAEYRGARYLPPSERTINIEKARLPRMKNRRMLIAGRVANVAQAVAGPKAHPPKVEKILKEKINKKEKKAALRSAIACTANKQLVGARHVLAEDITLPLVVVNDFEELKKTKEVVSVLKALKVYSDVESAKRKRKKRAGKGKKRGRKFKKKKSILIVTSKNSNVYKAARNLEGVDVCTVKSLNVDLLAPGTQAGRLTLWTEAALKELEKW